MTTAKDLATDLGLAVSTVGRALANDPRISPATTARVQAAAAATGYMVNRAARMMRGARSNLVGLVLPDIRNSFYSTIAHALSTCLGQGGFQLALSETSDDPPLELRHLRELASAKAAGILIVPSISPHADSAALLTLTPHLQLLRRQATLGAHWFGIDDVGALDGATRHLLQGGHRRIAYIGGTADLSTGANRLAGFQQALAGTAAAARAVIELGPPADSDFGRDAVRRLLQLRPPPTALVTGSVRITQGVLQELHGRGVRVPGDLSVVGFGDELGFDWWGPGLTTVALPVAELATAAGRWFMQHRLQASGPTVPGPAPHSVMLPTHLIERGSTRAIPKPRP